MGETQLTWEPFDIWQRLAEERAEEGGRMKEYTWKGYERLVASLVKRLGSELEGEHVEIGNRKLIAGASGFHHRIDVSVRGEDYLYIAECKCWNRMVRPEVMLTFLGRWADIRDHPDNQGIVVAAAVVTTLGNQEGAQKVADSWGIWPEVVRDEHDFVLQCKRRIAAGLRDNIRCSDENDRLGWRTLRRRGLRAPRAPSLRAQDRPGRMLRRRR